MRDVRPRDGIGRETAASRIGSLGWRIALTFLCLLLAWRVGALGVARLYSERLQLEDRVDAAQQMLSWHAAQPDALYALGLAQMDQRPDVARALAAQAYGLNPTRPWPLLLLAALAEAGGDEPRAEQLVDLAAKLAPVNAEVLEPVADYWESRGQLDVALRYWSSAIEAGSPRTPELFRHFRELLMAPEGQHAFRELVRRPPPWWGTFFVETTAGETDLELVRLLYDMRRASGAADLLSPEEHLSYVQRLLGEGDFESAYKVWTDSLLPPQREQLGLLYNGGFELPTTGVGFDWHLVKHEHATIDRAPHEGARGQSLRIVFRFSRTRFDNLYQPLHLAPGAYRVSGRYRSEKLYSDAGLRWLLNCRSPATEVLGESRRILGSEDWSSFSFEAEVSADCPYQEIRLASAETHRLDDTTDGTLWFDDLQIVPIPELSSLERARLDARRAAEAERERLASGAGRETKPGSDQAPEAGSGQTPGTIVRD